MLFKSRMIKSFIMMILFVAMFTGCSSGGKADTAAEENKNNENNTKDEIVYVNFRDIRDLNPHIYSGELFAQNLLFEGLVMITDEGVKPWLAKDWDISEDGRTYTFHIRQGITFSDGHKFDAHAVEANIQAIYDNKERHGWLESIRLLDGFAAIDDYTFEMKLKEPYYPLLVELAVTRPFRFISPNCFIDGTTKNGVNGLIGTGKYVLAENHKDQYAVFDVNTNYWGERPEISRIIAKVIPDNQIRTLALEKGEIDIIFGTNMVDAETYLKFSKMEGFGASLSDPLATRMLIMNSTDKILSDVNVRQAINAAVNREEISEEIFYGLESPADRLLAKTVPYCNVELEGYKYSLEKSNGLLEETGWKMNPATGVREKDGKPLEVLMHYNADSVTEKNISEYLQDQMRNIGLRLNITGEEEQAYRDRMKAGDFSITFNISWGTPYDPHSFLGGMRMPAVYGDYAAQQGLEEVKKLHDTILEAFTSTDEIQRQAYYDYILTYLHNEAIYVPLTFERNRAVYNEKVKNVTFNPSQYEVPLDRMYIE
ncbi:nickel ABC transporter substrate-binding protein [Geosporobacter ferrireducens]|uniref:Nickel ABC transporter, nickel/metallophore periplasmic binding protein n=1 Tax=Geosporobacter ferrireducens TaxID=1424294 RepID=A0A1D8GF77_9FIRM|nr:nickel ABC transporter substrate-binding protein [Geosporobacter ferrireducens]AOT69547.1 nickel ABC transporter, nickel/metallophore periplasmic binding protein [Geosporobacter ferrireducens]